MGSPKINFPGLLEAPKPKHHRPPIRGGARNKPAKSECSKRPSENHLFAPLAAARFVPWGFEHCDLFEMWCLVLGHSADRIAEVACFGPKRSPATIS
jgi:hypothetical protein